MPAQNKFSLDVSRWVEKAKDKADTVLRKTCLDLFSRVVLRTPVETGRLRGAWLCTVGTPSSSAPVEDDKSGGKTIGEISGALASAKMGDTIYLVNNTSYAAYVEFGTSKMAPRAMVGRSVAEFQQLIDKANNSTKE
jgi:hypothetical protein